MPIDEYVSILELPKASKLEIIMDIIRGKGFYFNKNVMKINEILHLVPDELIEIMKTNMQQIVPSKGLLQMPVLEPVN